MTQPAYTTRAESEAPPKHLIELMAEAAYTSTKTPSFPSWTEVSEPYRQDVHRSILAALSAAEAAGWRAVKS